MTIARSVDRYLSNAHIEYETLEHVRANTSWDSAMVSHIPGKQMVKAVVLQDRIEGRYLMALVPASRDLDVRMLNREIGRDLHLVSEDELQDLFPDCEMGAVPGFGIAYNMPVIWDDALASEDDVYFEAGDHQQLVHVDHDQFMTMHSKIPHGPISRFSSFDRVLYQGEYF